MGGATKAAQRPKLDIDRTRDQLIALGCGRAADQSGDVLNGAVAQETAPHAVLDQMLGIELAGREERRIRITPKLSNPPSGQTLVTFDFAFQPAIERSRIETLATGAWVRGDETVLMQGPPGVGQDPLGREPRREDRPARLLRSVLPLR